MKIITLVLVIISVFSVLDGTPREKQQGAMEIEEEKTDEAKIKPARENEILKENIRRISEKAARMVNKINNSGTTWIWLFSSNDDLIIYSNHGLPYHFDAREEWPECPSIRHIYDQGRCNSCGVVAVVSAFTDRICIKTRGKMKSFRSVQQVLTCCSDCADGCDNSYPRPTWEYLKDKGVVIGGDYASGKGCQPYQVPSCSHNLLDDTPLRTCLELPNTTVSSCPDKCSNRKYKRRYKNDKRKGVYQYVTGNYVGKHSVRVLGWGVEDGTPYWLAANSWNEFWGDKGTFKIIRGLETKGNLKFETAFSAGTYSGKVNTKDF